MTFANSQRGLRIAGTEFVYLSEGAYALVFVDRAQKRIRKVFRRRADLSEAHCRQVFRSEVDAYEIASKDPDLASLIPTYYGTLTEQTVTDRDGNALTTEFNKDMAFEAACVEGIFQKISAASGEETSRIVNLFRRKNIHHIIDSCVCLQEGKIVKLIDFSVREVVPSWDDPL